MASFQQRSVKSTYVRPGCPTPAGNELGPLDKRRVEASLTLQAPDAVLHVGPMKGKAPWLGRVDVLSWHLTFARADSGDAEWINTDEN